jgi:ATP-dependent Clp protease adapter protein ClpS
MAPRAPDVSTDTTLNPIEVRLDGGMLALNRFLMTLQNKRMPVASFAIGRDGDGMRATMLLDCPPEMAQRYTVLLSALEDVQEIGAASVTMEVALLKMESDAWRESAARAGIGIHEDGDTVVASAEQEKMEAWLTEVRDDLEDLVRLGPVARPGNGGV